MANLCLACVWADLSGVTDSVGGSDKDEDGDVDGKAIGEWGVSKLVITLGSMGRFPWIGFHGGNCRGCALLRLLYILVGSSRSLLVG